MRYKMLVLANATKGKEEEFNRWYDEQHLGDVLAIPGVLTGERFKIAGPADKWSYLALYDIETDDIDAFRADLGSRAGTDAMPISDAIDVSDVFNAIFIPQ
ncbi:hypothetical protein BH10PSE13_BH10PSE13_03410 [soil metagenome]